MIKSNIEGLETANVSFGKYFRLIFVIFSLYLMDDAFFRWDGFSYYASFYEFLPSVALASILWGIIAVITATFVWLLLSVYDKLCKRTGLKIRSQHVLFFTVIFVLLGALAWEGKKFIWPDVETSGEIKIIVFLCVVLVSIILSVLFRNKTERWLSIIQERITPLVWLFGIFVVLSVPLVAYHAWFKGHDKTVSAGSQSSYADKISRPNIILVTFDALTARNMSVYGYHKNTTPFINEWAKKATVFTKTEAESNFTTSATASLMTGKRVWSHQTFQIEGTPVKSDTESLPYLMKKNGYYNIAFVVNPHTSVEKLGMADSFDLSPITADFSEPASLVGGSFGYLEVYLYRLFGNKIKLHDWVLKNDFILGKLLIKISNDFDTTAVPPEKVFSRFLKLMDGNVKKPFFAWIHVLPPHEPYLPTEPFKKYFNSSYKLRSFKAQENIKDESYKYLFDYLRFPAEIQPDVDLMKDYYDEFIRYCDKQLEEFIEKLNERNMLDNTVIVFSADHGESFEHGYFTHGGPFLYEQVTHVPFILREPGQTTGKVLNNLVEQIDIPATILDLVDITVPAWMEGRSVLPFMRGEHLTERPAFSMNFEENPSRGHQITRGSIAVWEGDYKLIHYIERGESLLFNLKVDPQELNNLFNKENETGQRLLRMILDRLEQANERIINQSKSGGV
jgi:arylsulfatase A-like enzyme